MGDFSISFVRMVFIRERPRAPSGSAIDEMVHVLPVRAREKTLRLSRDSADGRIPRPSAQDMRGVRPPVVMMPISE